MHNIIPCLVVIALSLAFMKTSPAVNRLYECSIVLLTAYYFSLSSRSIRLSPILGYILAGTIIGFHGIGLVTGSFSDAIPLVEILCAMIAIISITGYMVGGMTTVLCLKYIAGGALCSLAVMFVVFAILVFLNTGRETALVMCLVSGAFSPVMLASLQGGDDSRSRKALLLFSFGGMTMSLFTWGGVLAALTTTGADALRLGSMPLFSAVTSTIAGIIAGFIADRMVRPYNPDSPVTAGVISFLLLPFTNLFGFDFLFLAFGIGIYNGAFMERSLPQPDGRESYLLVLFALFGMWLPLDAIFRLTQHDWSVVLFSFSLMIAARSMFSHASFSLLRMPEGKHPMIAFGALGPISYLVIRRFLPGFRTCTDIGTSFDTLAAIVSTTVLADVIFTLLGHSAEIRLHKNTSRETINA